MVIKKVYLVPPPQRKGGAGGSSSSSSASIEILDANGRTLLRFDVLKNSNQYTRTWNNDDEEDEEGGERQQQRQSTLVVAEDADDSTRNAILDHIHALIEWEQRRRTNIAMLGEEIEESGEGNYDVDYEYDNDDDGNTMSPRTAKKKSMIAEQGNRRVFSFQYITLRRKSNHSISLFLYIPSISTKTKAFCTTRNGITKIEEGT